MSPGNERAVLQISEDGTIVEEYRSLITAAKSHNCTHSNIRQSILKGYRCKGFFWQFKVYDLPDEIWKDHPTLKIKCSTKGRVEFLTGKRSYGSTKTRGGYKNISVKNKTYYVSRLIAETFLENPTQKQTVDHIDRNRINNNLSNLRWATMSEQNLNKTNNKYLLSSEYHAKLVFQKPVHSVHMIVNFTLNPVSGKSTLPALFSYF